MQPYQLSVFLIVATAFATAQSPPPAPTQLQQQVWQMQDSGTTAGLRGIDSVDGTIAWASGSEGTVLRTIDGGAHWQMCTVTDAAKDGATLDYRGVQAWDATTAIVMASGPGEKSRLYKTTDGCKTWTLLQRNTCPDGFYDTIAFWDRNHGLLVGDPVRPQSAEFCTSEAISRENVPQAQAPRLTGLLTDDAGANWANGSAEKSSRLSLGSLGGAAFAASNTSAYIAREVSFDTSGHEYKTVLAWIGIGGKGGARVFLGFANDADLAPSEMHWSKPIRVPMVARTDSSGVFSLAFRLQQNSNSKIDFTGDRYYNGIAVGGDYTKPNGSAGTAAWSTDGGKTWTASTTPPHGYRSTVQWSEPLKLWITAGTNGSDISRDDGRTWQPLDNGNWNALSLPFIVGPKGRIARLSSKALVER